MPPRRGNVNKNDPGYADRKVKKYNVVTDELKIKKGGVYAVMPFEELDEFGKAVFKVGMAEHFDERTETYHGYFPHGIYLASFLIKIPIPVGKRASTIYKKAETFILDELENRPDVHRIYATTRVKAHKEEGGRTDFFYCTPQAIHEVFQKAAKETGGSPRYFHLNNANKTFQQKVAQKGPKYIGKVLFKLPKGGKLSVNHLKSLLKSSYSGNQVDGYTLDPSLSTKTSKVYLNPNTGQTVVAHRGTSGLSDWFNNAVYAVGGERAYKLTPRYQEAKRVQEAAEKKYGSNKVTTIGHSQGGLQAELLGKNSHEIITLNKATRPFSNHVSNNQYDIRAEKDIVSGLNPFHHKSSNQTEVIIPSKTSNPLTEHEIAVLERLEGDRDIGRAEGEGFSRFKRFKKSYIGKR